MGIDLVLVGQGVLPGGSDLKYSLKAEQSGGERRHSRHREQQVREHRGLGKDGPFRKPIDTEAEKGIMAAETAWCHVQSGSQEGLCTKLGKPCPVTKRTTDRSQVATQPF